MDPIEVANGCPEQPIRGPSRFARDPEQQLIDDFEHEGTALPRVGGRDGSWVAAWDGTAARPEASASDLCAGRDHQAGHFVGSDFTSWGANWTATLRSQANGMAVPYDASPYAGISFWAALSPTTSAPYLMSVGVTTMDVAWNGGVCMKCMDYYRTTLTLGHEWRRYEVRFEDLAQSGTGDRPVPLRLDRLVGLIVWPTGNFDLWIDDVRFEQ